MTGLLNGAVYAHAVSWDVKIEPALLHDIVFRQAARQPRAIAIDFYGRRTTYGELGAQVRRMAAGFLKLGLGPGARVGLFLPNCPQYVVAYYGALAAGATVVNFSPLYSPEELEAQAADAAGAGVLLWLMARGQHHHRRDHAGAAR